MRHLAASHYLDTQSALRSNGNLVFRGLAVDQEPAAQRSFIRNPGAQAVALLTHQKQHAHSNALSSQTLTGGDLGGRNSLCVARPAPVDVFVVLRGWNKGRHGVDVSGKDDLRRLVFERGLHVEAVVRHGNLVDAIVEPAKLVVKGGADRGLVSGDRFNIN